MALLLIGISAFLHAGWNLLAHSQRADSTLFLRTTLITSVVGLVPVLIAGWSQPAFPAQVWGLLLLAGVCQTIYFLGLSMGYRSGDFTIVYPLARALPVLLLALVDLARGRVPALLGWAGMVLVMAGCTLAPLDSLREVSWGQYRNRALLWVLVTALGTVGYTTVDKIAAELLPIGPISAARYEMIETMATLPFLWLALRLTGLTRRVVRPPNGQAGWIWAGIAALFIFAAYWLVLWAYQLSPFASIISALRQFSIVIGVIAAVLLLHEPARGVRITAALVITAGIVCIGLASI